jgi:hypothetical protein
MSRYKKFRSPPRVFLHTHTNTQTKSQQQTTSFFFSLSLTYSLLYGITKPPYNLLKGDVARSLALFIPMYTPEARGAKSRLDGNCTLMQSRKKVRATFLWPKEIGRLNII